MMKFESAHPYIACFVILKRKNSIAFLLRKNTNWMDGFWGLPAGKVEWGEPYVQAAVREAYEEAGVKINGADLHFRHISHRHSEDTDWIDVYFEASKWQGEPYNAEEHKAERIDWLQLGSLPENVVPSQRAALEAIMQECQYSEYGW